MANKASSFLLVISPGLAFKVQAMLARSHMKAQRVMWPSLVVQLIVVSFHVGGLQFFVNFLSLGFNGIAITYSLSFTV